MSSEDAQGWVPATCLEAQDDPDDFSLPGEEGIIAFTSSAIPARDNFKVPHNHCYVPQMIFEQLE